MGKKKGAADQLAELTFAFLEGALKGVGIMAIIGVIIIALVLVFCFSW